MPQSEASLEYYGPDALQSKGQCYRCGEAQTSSEHVPPRCLFPAAADIGGKDYRVRLITVPSCDLHNTAKSTDDEFLMVSMAGVIGNNSVGYQHKLGKVDRALKRRSYKLLDKVLLNKHALHRLELENNAFIDVLWGTPDVARLTRCFENIAYGLHAHHFGTRFIGSVRIHLGFLQYDKGNPRNWNAFLRERAELDLAGKSFHGDNPEVFRFQVTDRDNFETYLIKMHFYGGLDVYAAFVPAGIDLPPDPITLSLRAGLTTIATIGDKTYQFEPRDR